MTPNVSTHPADSETGSRLVIRKDPMAEFAAETVKDLDSLVELAMSRGRILIQAPPGAGKTMTLLRVKSHTLAPEVTKAMRMAYVPLRALAGQLFPYNMEDEGSLNEGEITDLIFSCASPREIVPEALRDGSPTLILVDGLDEISDALANRVLMTLGRLSVRLPNVAVIATDRVARRGIDESDWMLIGLPSAAGGEAHEARRSFSGGVAEQPLLREVLSKVGGGRPKVHEVYAAYLDRIGFGLDDLSLITESVSDGFARGKPGRIDLQNLEERGRSDLIQRLLSSGLIIGGDRFANIADRSIAEYLVARVLARGEWTPERLSYLANDGRSIDVLTMACEQLPEKDQDRFVRSVHDWNFYVCIEFLAIGRRNGAVYSEAMEVALLCMFADRRSDLVRASRDEAEAILLFYPWELAASIRRATSHSELGEMVKKLNVRNDWFQIWVELFSAPAGRERFDRITSQMTSETGIVGWAAANAARVDTDWPSAFRQNIASLLRHKHPVIRWRAAHTLGCQTDRGTAELLLTSFAQDGDEDVKYGALRSLIEVAARSGQRIRSAIFRGLASERDLILSSDRLAQEVERDLIVSDPPGDWVSACGELIEALWAGEGTVGGQDRWRAARDRLRRASA